ncbi:Alcohol dehydrogenase zinc-binding domain protein [Cellulomonas flavigena DSM 20109]|uniref:Alcohol dehydrogenase zinc-binding domain protein n=1 Tax=Cellulomonas flavigena (strain ATCC 482 / DSM 20109 / BCRC 11376 / JCM 18109 / NBRC 3775 / NCIMB 8073 / NRS 134) TaxID=446466 RepID=D5UJ56_CELFN|nr:NADP-dependent oxidoreductase [Cellulomonas flavigena]ADG73579.1 Alcohol dehydrogenase zinc-binding domain protein [Cellulomonas flavigena DSM 20109]
MAHVGRAVVAGDLGGPEVLQVVEVETPAPGPGEVVVRVDAAGVNPWDWKSYAPGSGTRTPVRLGLEVAGVVQAVGPGVRWYSPGDDVVAWPVTGGYADLVTVPQHVLVRRPARLDVVPAAGLLAAGVTAAHAVAATGVDDEDVVLVHGASGGVGRMAVQLAVLRGARVVATASPAWHECLRRLGAEPVAYGPGLLDRVRTVEGTVGRVSVAIDAVGTAEALDTSAALVADRRRVATLVALDRAAGLGVLALGHGPGADPGADVRDAARSQLTALAADGSLDVLVTGTFPLEDAAAAHRRSREGHAGGKLVLTTR